MHPKFNSNVNLSYDSLTCSKGEYYVFLVCFRNRHFLINLNVGKRGKKDYGSFITIISDVSLCL